MKFTYNRKIYIYDRDNEVVHTEKGNLARDQKKLIKIAKRCYSEIEAKGFNLNMNYQDLEQYLTILSTKEKEKLFHQIYEAYLYVNTMVSERDQKLTQTDFFKCMAKLKRYENYLYIILKS